MKRNYPKLTITLGGPPPKRGTYHPWFAYGRFAGDRHYLHLPFFKIWIRL